MNYTSTRIRNFGSRETEARIAARVASYATPEAIRADQAAARAKREARTHRQEATVTTEPTSTPKPASEASINFLVKLSAERTPHVAESVIREWAATMGQRTVSSKIDELKKLPVVAKAAEEATTTPDVPAGRYAVTGEDGATKFYRVDRPTEGKWAGYVFVKVQAGDELHPLRGKAAKNAVLAKIVADGVQEAMLRYGREIGECGHCGRTLTNEESRELGIGPICRSKMGW
jgi:cell pole-organizing protein PopZ